MTMDPFEMLNTGPLRCVQDSTYTVQFLVRKYPYNTTVSCDVNMSVKSW